MTVLLGTHVLHWWSAEPERLSKAATKAVTGASELAVAAITWYELAWLARRERILLSVSVESWLDQLASSVRTIGITPAIARTAVALPATFSGDPADRLIYATAVERGWPLITKDARLRRHPHPRRPRSGNPSAVGLLAGPTTTAGGEGLVWLLPGSTVEARQSHHGGYRRTEHRPGRRAYARILS